MSINLHAVPVQEHPTGQGFSNSKRNGLGRVGNVFNVKRMKLKLNSRSSINLKIIIIEMYKIANENCKENI